MLESNPLAADSYPSEGALWHSILAYVLAGRGDYAATSHLANAAHYVDRLSSQPGTMQIMLFLQ